MFDEQTPFSEAQYKRLQELRKATSDKRAYIESTPPSNSPIAGTDGDAIKVFISVSAKSSAFQQHVSKCADCLTAIAEKIMPDVVAAIGYTGQTHTSQTFTPKDMERIHAAKGDGKKVERARISKRKKGT